MAHKFIYAGAVSALLSMPVAGYADETASSSDPEPDSYHSGLEDFSLRRDITGISHFYFIQPQAQAESEEGIASDAPLADFEGGSAGGYVSFGSPPTSTFLGPNGDEDDTLIDGVAFGLGWRPDVSGAGNQDFRRTGRGFSGSEIDRVGVRADLTALLYDETAGDTGSTAWRVTGMLGSTSLSLLSDSDSLGLESPSGAGSLLWDIGVGWSSGAMSVNTGYQSTYSLDETGEGESAIAVLSLGADYAVLPGLSVYGEFNVIDGPPDDNYEGLGTVVIVGTGVSF
jgi:hypothetical protein